MGISRACGSDIFALNDIIDNDKISVLYRASLTECSPNDPFNDWSRIIEEIVSLYFDVIDVNSTEQAEIEFIDTGIFEEFILTDDWSRIIDDIINLYFDVIDVNSIEQAEIEFIDTGIFEEFILTDDW
jgi:hypothetical protein